MGVADKLIPLLIPALVLLHLAVAPYTKVEESFNIQAVHDILTYGIPKNDENALAAFKADYDHFSFPGVVPRSFVGAVVLSQASSLPIRLLKDYVNPQVVVRAVLGLFNSAALIYYGAVAKRTYGSSAANWYYILQATQFHVLFYASRTLPNMFAFGLTTIALAQFIPSPKASTKLGIYLLTLSSILFRSEIALLLLAQISYLFLNGKIRLFRDVIPAGLLGGLIGLGLTLKIDSFFWQSATPSTPFTTPILSQWGLSWPELAAFHFNALQGKSSEWGIEPWHYYFTNALPRLLMNPFAVAGLIPFALGAHGIRDSVAQMLMPLLGFVLGYSSLPHKEWRFVVYVVPPLTLAAALGADYIWRNRHQKALFTGLLLLTLASVIASTFGAFGLLAISSINYPGGFGVEALYDVIPALQTHTDVLIPKRNVTIHLDVPVCMTGATRFLMDGAVLPIWGERKMKREGWVWDKTEDVATLGTREFWEGIDVILTGIDPESEVAELEKGRDVAVEVVKRREAGRWESRPLVRGWGGVKVYRPTDEIADDYYERLFGKWGGKADLVKNKVREVTVGWWVGPVVKDLVWVLYKKQVDPNVPEDW